MTHAPYAILGDLTLVYGKTTKTACGKRVATASLVSRDEATCTNCLSTITDDRAQMDEIRSAAQALQAEGRLQIIHVTGSPK